MPGKGQFLVNTTPKYNREQYQKWYAENKERKRAYVRARYAADPERFKAASEAYRKANPGSWRESHLKRTYGISLLDRDALLERQKWLCAICQIFLDSSSKTSIPHVDHDHKSGRVRGLLCSTCNTSLGHVERPGFLEAAQKYLKETTCDLS